MSTIPVSTLLGEDDLNRLEREAGLEFVNGQLVEKPVSVGAAEVEATIIGLFRIEAIKTGTVRVFGSSMGYQCFPEDPLRVRRPDVSVIRSERLIGFDSETAFMPIPADLAVEV